MSSMSNSSSSSTIITCLNRLENIKNVLRLDNSSPEITSQISTVISDIKMHYQITKINNDLFSDMQQERNKLQHEKQAILSKHRNILQNLEMLIYQKDYQQLKVRLNEFKNEDIEQTVDQFTPRLNKKQSNQSSKLDRAFVLQDSQRSDIQFLSGIKSASKSCSKLQSALDIINSSSPFEKKEEAWLQIIYSKNQDESIPCKHVTQREVLAAKRSQINTSEFQISLTEQNHPPSRHNQLQFTAKKMKSMILLKEKSSKKKPKTSVKKDVENQNRMQNAEQDHDKLKKKLQFSSKMREGAQRNESRRKILKQSEIKGVKSFRKTIINNC